LEDKPAAELDESVLHGDLAAPLNPPPTAPSHCALPTAHRPLPRWDSLENRRTVAVILSLIIVGGLILRTYGLYGRSMWFDESQSWRLTQFSFAEMIDRLARDNHAPLFFILMRAWTRIFGESIVALRNFSLAFAGLAMLGVYLFTVDAMRLRGGSPHPLPPSHAVASDGRERGDSRPHPLPLSQGERGDYARARWVGLVATALFAVSLFQIRMVWEIRMYAMGTALAMLSSWLLVWALAARPARGLPWVLYMLVGLLFAYTHYGALFSLFAQCLFALVFLLSQSRWNPKTLVKDTGFRWFVLAYAGLAAGWSAWLPVFLEQRQRVAGSWHHNTPFSLTDVPGMCYEMFFHREVHGWSLSHGLIVTALCGLAVLVMLWRGRAGEWLTACLAVVPFALISLVSSVSSNLMVHRYVAFLQPFLLIAIAAALGRIPISWLRGLIAYAVASAGLLLHVDFVDSLDIANRPGASAAAAYIDSKRNPGEPVIACSPLLMFPTLFHSRNREGWYVYSDRPEVPYYAGGSMLTDKEILFDQDMDWVQAKRAWMITTSGGWARWGLYIPPAWTKANEERFREVYAFQNDVVVICYQTR